MTNATLLTREIGLAEFIDPLGNTWTVTPDPAGTALYIIMAVNEDGEPVPPRSYPRGLADQWTSNKRATKALVDWLTESWDKSDAVAARNVRSPRRTASPQDVDIIAA